MEFLLLAYVFIVAHWAELLAIAFAVEVVAVQIVNLLPKDSPANSWLAVFHKVLVFVANIVPNAKTVPK